MAFRLYIVPSIGDGKPNNVRRPKYLSTIIPRTGGAMYYGMQPIWLCGYDLTPAQDSSVVANADVYAFPFDLTPNIGGGGIQAVKDAHESRNIPAQNLNAQTTWYDVGRYDAGLFQYMQRLNGVIAERTGSNQVVLTDSSKLNIQFGSIPTNGTTIIQSDITNAAQSLGYDTSFIQSNTQIRQILDAFSRDWGDKGFFFGPFAI